MKPYIDIIDILQTNRDDHLANLKMKFEETNYPTDFIQS